MASELIEKIKVFYFLTLRVQRMYTANLRNVAPGAVIGAWGGVLEWGLGNGFREICRYGRAKSSWSRNDPFNFFTAQL